MERGCGLKGKDIKWVLDNTSFNSLDLTKKDFGQSLMSNVTFIETKLEEARFSYSELKKVKFCGVNGYKTALHNMKCRDSEIISSVFSVCNFNASDLNNISGMLSSFDHSTFILANLAKAKLYSCSFEYARFNAASFQNADLYKSNFSNSIFVSTNFCGASLVGVNFENAKFSHAYFDEDTIFPKGFNPVEAGFVQTVKSDLVHYFEGCNYDE